MQCFVEFLIILFGKHYIVFDIFNMSLSHCIFSPAGRRVMIIVIVPYYFEFVMPSDLIWTPLLVMDFFLGGGGNR